MILMCRFEGRLVEGRSGTRSVLVGRVLAQTDPTPNPIFSAPDLRIGKAVGSPIGTLPFTNARRDCTSPKISERARCDNEIWRKLAHHPTHARMPCKKVGNIEMLSRYVIATGFPAQRPL